jgi:hypothetical protein
MATQKSDTWVCQAIVLSCGHHSLIASRPGRAVLTGEAMVCYSGEAPQIARVTHERVATLAERERLIV